MQKSKSIRSLLALLLVLCMACTCTFTGAIVASADAPVSHAQPTDFLTFSDAGVANNTYTAETGGLFSGSLMGSAFSGYVSFSGESGQQLLIGGNNTQYGGLYFFPFQGSRALLAAGGEYDNVIILNDATAGTTLLNNEFKLTVSLTPAGNGDVTLGMWIDGTLYNDSYITLSKSGGSCETLFGAANSIRVAANDGTVSVRSVGEKEQQELPKPNLKDPFTFTDYDIQSGTYAKQNSLIYIGSNSARKDFLLRVTKRYPYNVWLNLINLFCYTLIVKLVDFCKRQRHM